MGAQPGSPFEATVALLSGQRAEACRDLFSPPGRTVPLRGLCQGEGLAGAWGRVCSPCPVPRAG